MNVLTFFETRDATESCDGAASRWQWLQRCWAVFGLLLIAATWRLWIPQDVYPQVPFLRAAGSLPPACQWVALAAVIVSLVVALVTGPGLKTRLNEVVKPWLFLTFVGAMAVLFLTDQHRLQPWAYQLVIYAALFGTVPSGEGNSRRAMALLRILTVSIYLFSALGKIDFQFLHTVGQQLLGVTFGFVGIGVETWPLPVRLLLAALFPLAELSIVVALTIPRLRRGGVWAAVFLHVSLLVVLGPWGLQHRPGVLIWNLFFIAQVLLLFGGPRWPAATDDAVTQSHEPTHRHWVPTCVVLTVVCLPLLEPIGWFDHWPAWGLYSPRNSRAIVEVHRAGLQSLPAELLPFVATADQEASWVAVDIDDWSLATLSAPIYPQDRFQLGVAESIATRYGLDRTIRVRLLGMSNRLSGVRQETTLAGRQQIVAAGKRRFWLNSHPAGRAND